MKKISNQSEFDTLVPDDGHIKEPIQLGGQFNRMDKVRSFFPGSVIEDDCVIHGLINLVSLDHVTVGKNTYIADLISLTTVDGLNMLEYSSLHGMSSIKSLKGLKMAVGCELHDLTNLVCVKSVKFEKKCIASGLFSLIDIADASIHPTARLLDLTPF